VVIETCAGEDYGKLRVMVSASAGSCAHLALGTFSTHVSFP
jgi:hypothetical protein